MPKKSSKPNAFMLFATEYKANEERKGHRLSLPEAIAQAGQIWPTMSDQKKAPYFKRAKSDRLVGKHCNEKYTSQGVPLSYIEKEKVEQDAEERLMKKEIEDTVKHGFVNDTLADQKYYFIMGNYFAKTLEESMFIPAEISLCEYSLKEGISNTFHSYINPGTCIFGHAYEAQVHADSTHKLPLPPKAMGEQDCGKLYREILQFIQCYDGENRYPPIYTHKESIPVINSILTFLKTNLDEDNIDLRVYPIHYLYYILKSATAEKGEQKKPESIYVTDAIFDRDVYEYNTGISCDYHEKIDATKFCTLSCVVRWGYMFSDYMCNDLALPMIPGRHIPINADIRLSKPTDTTSVFNDSESYVTETSFNSKSMYSDLTLPKLEPNLYDASHCNLGESSFPALGSDCRKKKHDERSVSGSSGFQDENNKLENPWAVRNKVKPRVPSENSFSFASIISGRGRGISSNLTTNSKSGSGRGRFIQN